SAHEPADPGDACAAPARRPAAGRPWLPRPRRRAPATVRSRRPSSRTRTGAGASRRRRRRTNASAPRGSRSSPLVPRRAPRRRSEALVPDRARGGRGRRDRPRAGGRSALERGLELPHPLLAERDLGLDLLHEPLVGARHAFVRRVRALLLGEAARLLAVVEAEDGGPAPDGAEQAVEPVVRGRAVGLDVR